MPNTTSICDHKRPILLTQDSVVPGPKPRDARQRILLVDDDPDVLLVMGTLLRKAGFTADCAENPKSALAQLRSHRPDLILLDVMMPEADGFEVCGMLKAFPEARDIPVIFVTGQHDVKEKLRAFEAGAVDYITKPVDPDETLARIRLHLGIHSSQVELVSDREKLRRDILQRGKTKAALESSLGKALIVATPTGEILFCSESAASLLRTYIPEMAAKQLPPDLLAGGAVGSLRIELVPSPEDKDRVTLALRVARPPASFRDLLSLGLTARETEILYWIAQGKTSPETGLILGISMNTVKKHVQNILPKLGVETRFAAALAASEILNRLQGQETAPLARSSAA